MKTNSVMLVGPVIFGMVGLGAAAQGPVQQLWVAPNGQPQWSGLLMEPNAEKTDGPLPSLAAARDAIRARRTRNEWTAGPIEVIVRGGTYFIDAPLEFGPQDSGTANAPVSYINEPGAKPIISGGRRITGFKPVEVNGKPAWAVEIPEVKERKWYFRQLFVKGQRCSRPRVPKEGFYTFTGLPGVDPKAPWMKGQTAAVFKPGDLKKWKNLGDVEIVALHFWVESRMPLAEVDESANLVTFTRASTFRLTATSNPADQLARYYVENVLEALTEPGQWYLDRAGGTLYYLPLPGETPEQTEVIAPRLSQLVRLVGDKKQDKPVQYVNFRGLSFQHADWALPDNDAGSAQADIKVPGAVYLQDAQQCTFADGGVSHVSNYALEITKGCRDIHVDNNEFTDLGAGGVKVGHDSSHSTVTNNEIGPGGLVFHSAVGVWIGHSGDNTVAHNHIHHLYYTGISVGWTWGYAESKAVRNVIEYNHIHHIGQGLLSDMGGIYTLGVSPGTRLCYNLIHDVEACNYGGWGLYNDEGSTGILLENNIVFRTMHGGYHQHYGKENTVRNNIFAFGEKNQITRSREEEHLSFTFEHNVVYFTTPVLLASNWKNEKFKMDYNLYYRTAGQPFDFAGASLAEWQKRGHDVHSVIADPLFVDPEHGNFTLKGESPALALGFKPIDTSRIGRLKSATQPTPAGGGK